MVWPPDHLWAAIHRSSASQNATGGTRLDGSDSLLLLGDQGGRLIQVFGSIDRWLRQEERGVIDVTADGPTDVRVAPAVRTRPLLAG